MRTALVLGSGDCLHDDLEDYTGPTDAVVACNEAGAVWSGALDAWVTLHPSYWRRAPWNWIARRAASGFQPAKALYTHDLRHAPEGTRQTHWSFPEQSAHATSGMFAVKVALIDLGFDRAVLCGMPMTNTPHFSSRYDWPDAKRYFSRVTQIPAEYRDRIRSMSGATKILFGSP